MDKLKAVKAGVLAGSLLTLVSVPLAYAGIVPSHYASSTTTSVTSVNKMGTNATTADNNNQKNTTGADVEKQDGSKTDVQKQDESQAEGQVVSAIAKDTTEQGDSKAGEVKDNGPDVGPNVQQQQQGNSQN